MSGADYQTWTTDGIAWDWIASELNLTITGEFVPPAPVEPIVELPLFYATNIKRRRDTVTLRNVNIIN